MLYNSHAYQAGTEAIDCMLTHVLYSTSYEGLLSGRGYMYEGRSQARYKYYVSGETSEKARRLGD